MRMTPDEAVERLLEAIPEFGPEYEESDGRPREPDDELLLHVVNAVWMSLIEWFAWGDDDEKAALVEAGPLQGPKTKSIRAYYLLPDQTKVAPARLPPDDESSSRRQDSDARDGAASNRSVIATAMSPGASRAPTASA